MKQIIARKNQIILAIFISIFAISDSTASAYPFLTKSKILKEIGAQVLVGENQNDAIVFDKDVLKEHHVNIDGTDTYIITDKGLITSKGKISEKKLLRMCADPYPGIGFTKVSTSDLFIVTGKDLEGIIQWYPAKNVSYKKSNCLNNIKSENAKITSYQSEILKGRINQARWSRKLRKTEIKKYCKSYAEWNEKINQQSSAEDLYNECLTGNWTCRDEERLIVTFERNNGECKEITRSSIDCDGKATTGEDLREFLGVVVIKKDKAHETWLIWSAPGYEGDGVYTIEINDLGKKEKPSEEWLVYNGC